MFLLLSFVIPKQLIYNLFICGKSESHICMHALLLESNFKRKGVQPEKSNMCILVFRFKYLLRVVQVDLGVKKVRCLTSMFPSADYSATCKECSLILSCNVCHYKHRSINGCVVFSRKFITALGLFILALAWMM